jgi:hypothetical protein
MFNHRQFAEQIRAQSVECLLLAIEKVETLQGAMNIYGAESEGKRRRFVLRAAERRIAQLRGEEPKGQRSQLIVEARVVEGTGRLHKHPGW